MSYGAPEPVKPVGSGMSYGAPEADKPSAGSGMNYSAAPT